MRCPNLLLLFEDRDGSLALREAGHLIPCEVIPPDENPLLAELRQVREALTQHERRELQDHRAREDDALGEGGKEDEP